MSNDKKKGVSMGTAKSASSKKKAPSKGSKLASLKKLILGASKKGGGKPSGPNSSKKASSSRKPERKVQSKTQGQGSGQSKVQVRGKSPVAASSSSKDMQAQKPVLGKKSASQISVQASIYKTPKLQKQAGLKNAPHVRNGSSASSDSVCREVACEGLSTTGGYCRLHYIKNWKKIKRKELILKEKKLNQYIEELVSKYPDKYIEAIKNDLASDKEFGKVIHDLDLDESIDDFDAEGDSPEAIIDHIKRDFEDEGEGF